MSQVTPEFIPFSKIGQFRNAVKDMRHIMGTNPEKTTFAFQGTVKLHGTNAAVGYCPDSDSLYAQSRSRIITPDDDNYGFAKWVDANATALKALLVKLGGGKPAIVYGEWAGKNIQKGVALTELEKFFCIFRIKVDGSHRPLCIPAGYLPEISRAYCVTDFATYNITVDALHPEKVVNVLNSITNDVEKQCPVGADFGVDGIGEGVVWRCIDEGYESLVFKVKGEKHAVSKVKTLAPVDPEKVANVEAFVNYAATENRLNQGVEVIGLSQANIGAFIGWVNKDINTEEADVLAESNLTMKDVGRQISGVARTFYLNKLNNLEDAA